MNWLYLALGILLATAGAVSMKVSDGLSKLRPTLLLLAFYAVAFYFIALALQKLDLSIIYAIWAGSSTVLLSVIGILYFSEKFTWLKAIAIVLIVAGVTGLRLSGAGH